MEEKTIHIRELPDIRTIVIKCDDDEAYFTMMGLFEDINLISESPTNAPLPEPKAEGNEDKEAEVSVAHREGEVKKFDELSGLIGEHIEHYGKELSRSARKLMHSAIIHSIRKAGVTWNREGL